jgi:hypothetical protein
MTEPTEPTGSPAPSTAEPAPTSSQPAQPVSAWGSPGTPRSAAGDASSRLSARRLVLGFAVVLGAILLIAAIAATLTTAPISPPDCQPGTECGGPPPGGAETPASPAALPPSTIGIRAGTPWINSALGFQFEYTDWWKVDTSNTDTSEVDLAYQGTSGDGLLIVSAVPTTDAGPQEFSDRWFGILRDWAPDLAADESEKNAILGPSIGFINGIGRTYAGSRSSAQSATTPVGISVVVASDGHTTVAVVLIVWNPDKPVGGKWLQYNIRSRAEIVLKTFRWGAAQ